MTWSVVVARSAEKKLHKAPAKDQTFILKALGEMEENPFHGDIAKLKGQAGTLRRRVGDWRIFFDVDFDRRVVQILAIERRTSTTY
jgi:mRNA-degrading endonuclease RelE of RelBE toxin-antitoxin system